MTPSTGGRSGPTINSTGCRNRTGESSTGGGIRARKTSLEGWHVANYITPACINYFSSISNGGSQSANSDNSLIASAISSLERTASITLRAVCQLPVNSSRILQKSCQRVLIPWYPLLLSLQNLRRAIKYFTTWINNTILLKPFTDSFITDSKL